MGEFVLALDVGTTSVRTVIARAAAHEELQVAPLAVGGERADIPLLAFITEDGDAIFGTEAERRGCDQPERVVHGFTRWIGDAVPLVVSGFSVSADELLARMVMWIIRSVAVEQGARPDAIALVHPTSWSGHRADAVRGSLRELDLEVTLMPVAPAVAQQHAAAGSRSHTICVYDLGGSRFEATILRGGRMLGEPQTADIGGVEIDAALLTHVLGMLPETATVNGTHAELLGARRTVTDAKERLSHSSDVSVPVSLGGRAAWVRVTRSELEAMAAAPIARTVEAVEQALESERLAIADLDEVILVGGSARVPLVAEMLSARLDVPLTVPEDPALAAATAAALRSWASLQAERAVAAPLVPELASERPAARRRPVRVHIPYGTAATLAAGAVIIAAGMVFAATTPLGGGSDSADGATADERVGSGLLSVPRPASGYSVADGTGDADEPVGADEERALSRPDGSSDADDDEPPAARAPRSGGPTVEPAFDSRDGSTRPTSSAASPAPRTDPTPPSPSAETPPAQPEETLPESEPTPQPEPAPEPAPTSEPEPAATAAPEPEPDPTPSPQPEPAPETSADPVATASEQASADASPVESPTQSSQTASDPTAETAAH